MPKQHDAAATPALEVTLPTGFKICGQMIPARLTLSERYTFAIGAGATRDNALFVATHDRAASLVMQLSLLLQRAGNAELVAKASELVQAWNTETDEFFARNGR